MSFSYKKKKNYDVNLRSIAEQENITVSRPLTRGRLRENREIDEEFQHIPIKW